MASSSLVLVEDVLVGVVFVAATLGALRRAHRDPATRAGWIFFALASGLNCIGQWLLVMGDMLPRVMPIGQPCANWFTIVASPLFGISLLAWPGAPRGRLAQLRMVLDGVIIARACSSCGRCSSTICAPRWRARRRRSRSRSRV